MGGPKYIVATDGSDGGKAAEAHAITLARAFPDASIVVVNVERKMSALPQILDNSESNMPTNAIVEEAVTRIKESLGDSPVLVDGKALVALSSAEAIIAEADLHQNSHIIIGSRGLGGFAGLLLGSVSQAIAQNAHCPVTIVRA